MAAQRLYSHPIRIQPLHNPIINLQISKISRHFTREDSFEPANFLGKVCNFLFFSIPTFASVEICISLFTVSTAFSTGNIPVIFRQILSFPGFYPLFYLFFHVPVNTRHENMHIVNLFHEFTKNAGTQLRSCIFLYLFTQDRFGSVCIQAHVSHIACQIFVIGLSTDHGAVVTAKAQGRHINLRTQLFRCG